MLRAAARESKIFLIKVSCSAEQASFFRDAPSRWHQFLGSSKFPVREVVAKKAIPLGLPIERRGNVIVSINADALRYWIHLGPCESPIPIFVIVVKPAPLPARPPVVTTRGKEFQIPIVGLDHAKFRAFRRNRTSDNSRIVDVPNEKCSTEEKSHSNAGCDDFGANSHSD